MTAMENVIQSSQHHALVVMSAGIANAHHVIKQESGRPYQCRHIRGINMAHVNPGMDTTINPVIIDDSVREGSA
jgi:hypothetical protein